MALTKDRLFVNFFTPYSMNSLFSELFNKFRGVSLGVLETIRAICEEWFGGLLDNVFKEQTMNNC